MRRAHRVHNWVVSTSAVDPAAQTSCGFTPWRVGSSATRAYEERALRGHHHVGCGPLRACRLLCVETTLKYARGVRAAGAGEKNQAPTEFRTRASVDRVFGCQKRPHTRPKRRAPDARPRDSLNFLFAWQRPLVQTVRLPALARPAALAKPQDRREWWKGLSGLTGSFKWMRRLVPGEANFGATRNIICHLAKLCALASLWSRIRPGA